MIEIIEYLYGTKIELGIDEERMKKIQMELEEAIDDRVKVNNLDAIIDDVFTIFKDNGIQID